MVKTGVRSFVTRALAFEFCHGITSQLRQAQLDRQEEVDNVLVVLDEDGEEFRKKYTDLVELAANDF